MELRASVSQRDGYAVASVRSMSGETILERGALTAHVAVHRLTEELALYFGERALVRWDDGGQSPGQSTLNSRA